MYYLHQIKTLSVWIKILFWVRCVTLSQQSTVNLQFAQKIFVTLKGAIAYSISIHVFKQTGHVFKHEVNR